MRWVYSRKIISRERSQKCLITDAKTALKIPYQLVAKEYIASRIYGISESAKEMK
jgi:hypothetical protein